MYMCIVLSLKESVRSSCYTAAVPVIYLSRALDYYGWRVAAKPIVTEDLLSTVLRLFQVAAFAPFAQPAISSPHCSGALYRAARPLPRSVKGVCVASSQADTAEATDSSAAKSSGKGGKDVVPSYRRLYDAAMELLEVELELEAYPIPEGLAGKSATVGTGRNQQVRDEGLP